MNRPSVLHFIGLGLLGAVLAQGVVRRDQAQLAALPADARAAWQPSVSWLPPTPQTRVLVAQATAGQEPDRVEAAWLAAHRAQPTATDPLFRLAEGRRLQGDTATADQLVAAAVRLAPAYARTHLLAAAYWEARQDIPAKLRHWSQALILDPARRPTDYPLLLQYLTHPPAQETLMQFARERPPWWPDFFRHVARHGSRADLDVLYALRRQGAEAPPLTPGEREAYINRLLRDGDTTLAYLHWIGGLSAAERDQLGLLYNGSFDLPLGNQPFGWVVKEPAPFRVRSVAIAGARGSGALELRFRHFTARFDHLRQRLLLAPGPYRLRGRVRLEALKSPAGLRWRVECAPAAATPAVRLIAASTPFLGSAPWQEFALEFAVPPDCPQQVLRLVTAGKRPFEYRLDGGIWFDQFSLRRVAASAEAPGAAAPPVPPAEEPEADDPAAEASTREPAPADPPPRRPEAAEGGYPKPPDLEVDPAGGGHEGIAGA